MKIIKGMRVERFRSIRDGTVQDLSDFSVLAGLNNSGKSNFLRALSAFFTGEVEHDTDLEIGKDFYRPERWIKKRKTIRIHVDFELPKIFNFRPDLRHVKELIGASCRITKEWGFQSEQPLTYLNGELIQRGSQEEKHVETFLGLINFRYIPNRVQPVDLMRREQQALRDVLIRRLARHNQAADQLFAGINQAAETITASVSGSITKMMPAIQSLRLATAQSLADLAFRFGYQINEGGYQSDESEQGSGLQSLLMLETLHLIDRDYFQKFGWRQAAIWALEEPESSLHTQLETEVAKFLSEAAVEEKGRLQILATTHSDLMIQYAGQGYFVDRPREDVDAGNAGTTCTSIPVRELLSHSAKFGVSRWVNPLLYFPKDPLVLVEGISDKEFIFECLRILQLRRTFRLETLADITDQEHDGGIERIIMFLEQNMATIRARSENTPVILVGDWDATNKVANFRNKHKAVRQLKTICWDPKKANPNLTISFRGVERFYSDRMIAEVERLHPNRIATTENGKKQILPTDYPDIKSSLRKLIIDGLNADDIIYASPFIKELYALASNPSHRDLYY